MDKQVNRFIKGISQLGPQEFIGLAKLMGVKFVVWDESSDEQIPVIRPAEDVGLEILKTFCGYNRRQRRNMMKFLDEMLKNKDDVDVEVGDVAATASEVLNGITTEDK